MEDNLKESSTSSVPEITQNNSKKNIGVIISFAVVVLVASVVLVSRLYPNARQKQMTSMSPTKSVPVANVMYTNKKPTPTMDTSDAQLDKDLQDVQGSLDTLDTNLNNADQSIAPQNSPQ